MRSLWKTHGHKMVVSTTLFVCFDILTAVYTNRANILGARLPGMILLFTAIVNSVIGIMFINHSYQICRPFWGVIWFKVENGATYDAQVRQILTIALKFSRAGFFLLFTFACQIYSAMIFLVGKANPDRFHIGLFVYHLARTGLSYSHVRRSLKGALLL